MPDKQPNISVEYLPVSKLKPYKNNARKHEKFDVNAIAESIKTFGFCDPIGLWGDDVIVEGHGRLLAAKQLGMETVPCIRLDHLSDEERRAYALAHNKTAENSEWDFDIQTEELSQITNIDMTLFGFEDPQQADEVVEDDYEVNPPEEPVSVRGNIYQLGHHRLMCGDSTDLLDISALMGGVASGLRRDGSPLQYEIRGCRRHEGQDLETNHERQDEVRRLPAVSSRRIQLDGIYDADGRCFLHLLQGDGRRSFYKRAKGGRPQLQAVHHVGKKSDSAGRIRLSVYV